jgi:poly(A) polymerase
LPARSDPLELIRAALAGQRAWLVGGAVRDRLLRGGVESAHPAQPPRAADERGGRALAPAEIGDLDVVLEGDPREAARALARAAGSSSVGGATAFALSEEYGGWRVVARDGAWQVDLERLRGATLEEDLALRDFTVNAIAEPLGEPGAGRRETIDPLGGVEDLARRRLRPAGPRAFVEDPLRVLRLVRLAVELDLEPDPSTRARARVDAEGLRGVAPERVFMELRRILEAPRAVHGVRLMGEVGATPVVLPELDALRGVEQSRSHHLDVYDHTLEVLAQTIALQEDSAAALEQEHGETPSAERGGVLGWDGGVLGREQGAALAALLAEPLADGLTRAGALRWGALLAETGMLAGGECLPASVDAAKPLTREVRPADGRRITFIGEDVRGAQLAGEVLGRLHASGRLRAHVAALVRHRLRLGLLVHDPQPLARRSVFAYLRACGPVAADVTLLSIADRLAGRNGDARRRRVSPGFGRTGDAGRKGDARWRRVSPGFGCGERAQESIDAHLRLARAMLVDAIVWRADGPPQPLLRGDELASDLGIPEGPRLGELLEELLEAQYVGEVTTREDALAYARTRAG